MKLQTIYESELNNQITMSNFYYLHIYHVFLYFAAGFLQDDDWDWLPFTGYDPSSKRSLSRTDEGLMYSRIGKI